MTRLVEDYTRRNILEGYTKIITANCLKDGKDKSVSIQILSNNRNISAI